MAGGGDLIADPHLGDTSLLWLPNFDEVTPVSDPHALRPTPSGWCLRFSPSGGPLDPVQFRLANSRGSGVRRGQRIGSVPDCAGAMSNCKNAALLVGFMNFQRLPILARQYFAPKGSPYGYLSDKLAATRLAERVIKGNYDIIAFAEVWTGRPRSRCELKRAYPYYVKKLDCGPFEGEFQDAGLMLFSRLPFRELPGGPRRCEDNLAFACGTRSYDVDFIRFGSGSGCSDGGNLGEKSCSNRPAHAQRPRRNEPSGSAGYPLPKSKCLAVVGSAVTLGVIAGPTRGRAWFKSMIRWQRGITRWFSPTSKF